MCTDVIILYTGAGHGGRGGRGRSQSTTGQAYGNLFEPTDHGCIGGSGHNSGNYTHRLHTVMALRKNQKR